MTAKTSSPPDPAARRIRRLARRAGLVLFWEGLCERGWPVVTLILLFVSLTALGLPQRLPGWGHLLLLAAFAGGGLWSLWRLRGLRWPSRGLRLRRLEDDSGLPHRPLTLLEDEMAAGKGDPVASTLWRLERKRAAERVAGLRLGWPRPVLAAADPLGLRFLPLLLLVLAGAGGLLDASLPDRLAEAMAPRLEGWGGPPPLLQVWVTPPAYTRQPPQHLQSLSANKAVTVPSGSVLLAELVGGHGRADLRIDAEKHSFTAQGADSQRLEMPLTRGNRLEIHQGFSTIASWPLAVIADQPPTVAFAGPPQRDRAGRLKIEVLGHDDYGIAKLWLLLRPAGQTQAAPQALELPIGAEPTPETRLTLWQDLTGNILAGREVALQLAAEDAQGQRALSAVQLLTLPEREFTNPVAQTVAALRKRLAQAPSDRSPVMAGLARVAVQPDSFHGDTTVFLALSVSIARLRWDRSEQAVPSVLDILWQTALRIEEGDRPLAEKTLAAVQKALEEALARNAPAAEIAQLMAELQTALDQYLDALVQDALRHGLNGQPANPDAPSVTPQDLQDLAEQIRGLAATGSREAARAMLKQLQQLTAGLQVSGKAPSQQELRQAQGLMGALGGLIEEQNRLLDQSFQENRRQLAEEDRDGLPILGQTQPAPRSGDGGAAGDRQDGIRARLGKLVKDMADGGLEPPQAFAQADQAMRDSSQALRRGELTDAVDAQSEAVARLQEGTRQALQALAQKMGGGAAGQLGLPGNTDPLGRPMQGGGLPNLTDQPLPSQSEMTKAREVLEELRRRSGEAQRPPEERNYLQRLLKNFF